MVRKLDDSTFVPLSWLAALLMATITATSYYVSWETKVDDRLGRIEQKLGLEPESKNDTINLVPIARAAVVVGRNLKE
jgi:hypothetical protein